jgi:phage baseplate assembly protein W
MPIYSDFNQLETSKKTKVIDIESIYQSIYNILTTRRGDRFFNPEFGSRIEELLFDPLDDITALNLLHEVVVVLERYEPRIRLDYANTNITPNFNENKFDISISGTIKDIEDNQFTFNGSLVRGNNV